MLKKELSDNSGFSDKTIQRRIAEVHKIMWDKFIQRPLDMVYTRLDPKTMSVKPILPTPEEIRRNEPNQYGWRTAIEDCNLYGNYYLDAMLKRFLITRSDKDGAKAQRIFKGMERIGTVSHRKGFIPRGIHPDGKSHYQDSSIDQYTSFLYGMWQYYHSILAMKRDKESIRNIIGNMTERLEKDKFYLLTEEGKPSLSSFIGNYPDIRIDRSCRLLQLLLVAHDITRDKHWLELYQQKIKEKNYARLRVCAADPFWFAAEVRTSVWGLSQNQMALRCLAAMEKNGKVLRAYRAGLQKTAEVCKHSVFKFQCYQPDIIKSETANYDWRPLFQRMQKTKRDPSFQNNNANVQEFAKSWYDEKPIRYFHLSVVGEPLEAMWVILLSDNVPLIKSMRGIGKRLLMQYDYEKLAFSTAHILAEGIFYTGVRNNWYRYS